MDRRIAVVLAVALAGLPAAAAADSLYVAAPAPAAPGHPLELGPDHRAHQVGDLVTVVFNFSQSSSTSQASTVNNSYNVSATPGTGLLNLSLIKAGLGLGATRSSSVANGQTGSTSWTTTMEAQVTDVLPSGALKIAGDQSLLLNGQKQKLHIVGVVRPEDIDNTDSVQSTQVADAQATFDGNAAVKNNGLLQKIVNFLF